MKTVDRARGIELNLQGAEQYGCRSILLIRDQDSIEAKDKICTEGSLATVFADLNAGDPLSMCLSGKGILHKTLIPQKGQEDQYFSRAFPSVKAQDFYIQIYESQEAVMVSIARKSLVDPLIKSFTAAGFRIFCLSFGAIHALQLWPQLNSYEEQLIFNGHQFQRTKAGHFESYRYEEGRQNEFPVKIGTEVIEEALILAYASAFQLLLEDKLNPIEADVESIRQNLDEYRSDELLKKQVTQFALVLLVALVLSFIIFSHYNSENQKLSELVGEQVSVADQKELTAKNISEQENLLKKLHWNGGYNHGFILNDIGSSLPRSVSLRRISDHEEKAVERETVLLVSGATSNLSAVNNWMFLLKEKPWVKNVKLLKYLEEAGSENYVFNLKIDY